MPGKIPRSGASQPSSPQPHRGSAETSAETSKEQGRLVISVRVTPRASRDSLTMEGGVLRVRLTAPPVEGAANEALVSLLAERLRLPKRAITLLRGAASRDKQIALTGISADELRARLDS